jgi:HK97 family phage major capsid protein
MAYNNNISRTDASALIPEEAAREILKAVPEQSAVMRLAKKLPNMSRAQKRLPVMSALATAYFNTGDNGLAQTSEVNWANKYIDAEELDVIVPIPKAVLEDADFDIWGECKPQLVEALALAVDQAVMYGTNIPSSWSTNLGETGTARAGIVARSTAASHTVSLAAYTDMYEALLGETGAGADGVMMLLEADGFMASGVIAHTSIRGKLRNCRDANGQPIFKSGPSLGTAFATGEVDGTPILYPLNGSVVAGTSLMIAGAWNQLVYAMRQDISYEISTQAVIQDAQGAIVYNLFQQNMVALKATMRLGFALPNPINRVNGTELTRCPFAVLTA